MFRRILTVICLSAALCLPGPEALAQRGPHVGYIYPAGGQRGSEFQATVGGQFLQGADGVRISGHGVDFTVVKHISALTQGRTVKLRQMLQAYRQQEIRARQRAGRNVQDNAQPVDPKEHVTPEAIVDAAKTLGYDVEELSGVVELLAQLRDPKRQPNEQIGERVILKVRISGDAPPGKRELRLETPQGLTNMLGFQVGPYAECVEAEPNDEISVPDLPAALPLVLNGRIMPGDVDRFRFQATKGMRLVAAAGARELIPYLADAVPGWFQATLRLLDGGGHQVAWCDDFRFNPDPVILYEVPADGDYVLEIADALYRGRDDFVYRIVLGEVPFVTGIFPLGGPGGKESSIQLTGWNLPANEAMVDATGSREGELTVFLNFGASVSNYLSFAVGAAPEIVEREPNNAARQAGMIDLPQIVNGRIDAPGDWDVYSFRGSAGVDITAEVLARRLASPLDGVLKLTTANGALLEAADDTEDQASGLNTHHADPRLRYTLPADGTYLLHVGDVQNAGGREYAYRLRVAPAQGDFLLRAAPANVNVAPGTSVAITVHALRLDGFNGPIDLDMTGLPAGVLLSGNRIPAGQDAVRMTLTIPPENLKNPQKIRPFVLNMHGTAVIDGRRVNRRAVPAEDQMQAFLWRHLVPAEEGVVTVAGQPRRVPPARYDQALVKLRVGRTVSVKIPTLRGPAAERFELELSDPPTGVSIKELKSNPKTGMAIVLQADKETAQPGTAGNLIFNIYAKRPATDKTVNPVRGPRRFAAGVLPALPFEVVK